VAPEFQIVSEISLTVDPHAQEKPMVKGSQGAVATRGSLVTCSIN